ncbi:curved DNA-binding protein [Gilvimarinus sp. F26214L]|uniref:curved DNA-binding protein n=1 Tax=Gilvimarinus sp. DZF01 TaxID=3461371 RepID=UPI004045AFDE
MEFKDYYKILGVDAEADPKTIKTAYRKLARKFHPDVSEQHDAEDRFKEVTEAYEVLGDPKKRAEYDELRQYGAAAGQDFRPPPGWQSSAGFEGGFSHFEGDFSDFFESIFGSAGRRSRPGSDRGGFSQRGRDVELDMPVFLEETLSEEPKQINYSLPHYGLDGSRLEDVTKTIRVKIPKGAADGERIRLKGQGAPGIGEGPPGDLYLRIRLVPHPLFDVEGRNLVLTVPLAPWEAALGAKITVPTLQGKIQLTIPPRSQSGQRLRVKGRGLAGKTGQGDLHAVLKVVMPPQLDDEIRAMWQRLGEKAHFDPRAEWNR